MAVSRKENSGGMRTPQWAPRRAALGPDVPLLLLRTTHRADGKI